MVTDRRVVFGPIVVGTLLVGCASTSIRGDLDDVRELAHAVALADVSDDVETVSDDDALEILGSPLDADGAVRIALLMNRELRATLREMGIARGHLLQAGLLPNPMIDAELLPERNTEASLRVEWDLAGLVLAPMRAHAASADADVSRYAAADAVVATGLAARDAFYAAQAAEETLAIAQQALDALAASRDAARALAAAGNLPALDLAAYEAEFEEDRAHVADVELGVVVAREAVHRALGLHGDETTWVLAGPLPEVPATASDPDDLERLAIDANIELLRMQAAMEAVARHAGVARAEALFPELLLDVHALVGDPADTTAPGVAVGVGLGVRLPIFDHAEGTIAAYEAELEVMLERYVGHAIEVRSLAREARARLLTAHARALQYTGVVVPLRQRVLDETLLRYNAMQVSVFQLLDAYGALQASRIEAVETRRAYWMAAAELEAVLAGHVAHAEAHDGMSGSTEE